MSMKVNKSKIKNKITSKIKIKNTSLKGLRGMELDSRKIKMIN